MREALTHVPGWPQAGAEPDLTRMPGGSVNRAYRVQTGRGAFVIRLSPGTDAWLTTDRSVERELHDCAAAAGIAPSIAHADERDRWLITEFIAGRAWCEQDFADAASLTRLALTLRRLHGLAAPIRGRFDLLAALRSYAQRIQPRDRDLERHVREAPQAYASSGAANRPRAIVHHDLSAPNLIDSASGLMLIDWECAAVADPLLDIACILSYYEIARPHAHLLLANAGFEGVTAAQLAAAVWLFDLHTLLWYRERRQRLSPTEAERRAEEALRVRVSRGPEPIPEP